MSRLSCPVPRARGDLARRSPGEGHRQAPAPLPASPVGSPAEVGEAFTAWRKHLSEFGEELADVAIYLAGIARMNGTDLAAEVVRKLAINERRTYRRDDHGGSIRKACRRTRPPVLRCWSWPTRWSRCGTASQPRIKAAPAWWSSRPDGSASPRVSSGRRVPREARPRRPCSRRPHVALLLQAARGAAATGGRGRTASYPRLDHLRDGRAFRGGAKN